MILFDEMMKLYTIQWQIQKFTDGVGQPNLLF